MRQRLIVITGIVFVSIAIFIWWQFQNKKITSLPGNLREALVIVWSPEMPLSVPALTSAQSASDHLGLPLIIYLHPGSDEVTAIKIAQRKGLPSMALQRMEPKLFSELGLLLHSPSLLVIHDGEVKGEPILGYNESSQYIELIERRLTNEKSKELSSVLPPLVRCRDAYAIEGKFVIPQTDIGEFAQPFAQKEFVLFANGENSYAFDFHAGKELATVKIMDPMPSSDEELVIGLDQKTRKLLFFAADEYLKKGENAKSILEDDLINRVVYQSIAPVKGKKNIYRVLARTEKGVIIRDYEYNPQSKSVKAVTDLLRLCPRLAPMKGDLSLPLISKDGERFFSRNDRNGLSVIYRFDPIGGQCTEEVIMPFSRMGKGNLNFTNDRIAFHAFLEGGLGHNSAFVYEWQKRTLWEIPPFEEGYSNSYPAFVKNGDLLVLSRSLKDPQKPAYFVKIRLKECSS